MLVEEKLKTLGLTLPEVPPAKGNYLPFVKTGNLLYLSGMLCLQDGGLSHKGAVGAEQTIESGYEAAKVCALNVLALIKEAAGSFEALERFVYVGGFVNGVAGFAQSPQVINGASDLLVEVLGDAGKHTRAAVTVAGLPLDATVEIQCVVELKG